MHPKKIMFILVLIIDFVSIHYVSQGYDIVFGILNMILILSWFIMWI